MTGYPSTYHTNLHNRHLSLSLTSMKTHQTKYQVPIQKLRSDICFRGGEEDVDQIFCIYRFISNDVPLLWSLIKLSPKMEARHVCLLVNMSKVFILVCWGVEPKLKHLGNYFHYLCFLESWAFVYVVAETNRYPIKVPMSLDVDRGELYMNNIVNILTVCPMYIDDHGNPIMTITYCYHHQYPQYHEHIDNISSTYR